MFETIGEDRARDAVIAVVGRELAEALVALAWWLGLVPHNYDKPSGDPIDWRGVAIFLNALTEQQQGEHPKLRRTVTTEWEVLGGEDE